MRARDKSFFFAHEQLMLQIVHKLGMVEKDTDTESARIQTANEFDRWLTENLYDESCEP